MYKSSLQRKKLKRIQQQINDILFGGAPSIKENEFILKTPETGTIISKSNNMFDDESLELERIRRQTKYTLEPIYKKTQEVLEKHAEDIQSKPNIAPFRGYNPLYPVFSTQNNRSNRKDKKNIKYGKFPSPTLDLSFDKTTLNSDPYSISYSKNQKPWKNKEVDNAALKIQKMARNKKITASRSLSPDALTWDQYKERYTQEKEDEKFAEELQNSQFLEAEELRKRTKDRLEQEQQEFNKRKKELEDDRRKIEIENMKINKEKVSMGKEDAFSKKLQLEYIKNLKNKEKKEEKDLNEKRKKNVKI